MKINNFFLRIMVLAFGCEVNSFVVCVIFISCHLREQGECIDILRSIGVDIDLLESNDIKVFFKDIIGDRLHIVVDKLTVCDII